MASVVDAKSRTVDYRVPGEQTKRRGRPSKLRIEDGFSDKDKALQTVKQIWMTGRNRMYPIMRQWAQQALFFRGYHYFSLSDNIDEMYNWWTEEEQIPDKVRLADNVLQKHVLAWVSRMLRNDPRVMVFSASGDEEDKDRADVLNKIVQWRKRQQGIRGKLYDAVLMAGIFGNSFLKSTYDQEAGEYRNPLDEFGPGDLELLDDPSMNRRFGGPQGLPDLLGRRLKFEDLEPEGDVIAEAVPCYEITLPDEYPRNMDEVSGVLHSRIVSVQEVKERYHNHPKADELRGQVDSYGHHIWFMRKVASATYTGLTGFASSSNEQDDKDDQFQPDTHDTLVLHEYWGRRTRTRPRGVRCVVANDILLEMGDNPYWHAEIPFVHIRHTPDGTNFWATSDIEQAIPIQVELNRSISQTIEARNRTANPIIVAERGHGVDFMEKENVPGELWEPRKGFKVDYLEPPQMPPYTDRLTETLKFSIEEIFGDHKPSQGQSKSGDSGIKVRHLQMADEARFAPFAVGFSESLRAFWLQQLMLTAQYTDRERIGYLMGEEGERSFFGWDRNTLLGTPDEMMLFSEKEWERAQVFALKQKLDLEIQVVPGKSQATVREDMLFLAQTGFVDPMRDKAKVMSMLGYGLEAEDIMRQQRQQASMAGMENDLFMSQMDVPLPGMHEDHIQHIEVHKRLVNSLRFRRLPEQEQMGAYQHIEQHERMLLAEQMRIQFLGQQVAQEFQQQFGPVMPPAAQGQPQGAAPQGAAPQATLRRAQLQGDSPQRQARSRPDQDNRETQGEYMTTTWLLLMAAMFAMTAKVSFANEGDRDAEEDDPADPEDSEPDEAQDDEPSDEQDEPDDEPAPESEEDEPGDDEPEPEDQPTGEFDADLDSLRDVPDEDDTPVQPTQTPSQTTQPSQFDAAAAYRQQQELLRRQYGVQQQQPDDDPDEPITRAQARQLAEQAAREAAQQALQIVDQRERTTTVDRMIGDEIGRFHLTRKSAAIRRGVKGEVEDILASMQNWTAKDLHNVVNRVMKKTYKETGHFPKTTKTRKRGKQKTGAVRGQGGSSVSARSNGKKDEDIDLTDGSSTWERVKKSVGIK